MRRMFCKNQRSRAIECLLTESHIHGNMYEWFGGRHGETSHRNMVWRPVSSLHTSEQVMLKFPTLHYYINSFWGSKLTIGLVYENICRCEL